MITFLYEYERYMFSTFSYIKKNICPQIDLSKQGTRFFTFVCLMTIFSEVSSRLILSLHTAHGLVYKSVSYLQK